MHRFAVFTVAGLIALFLQGSRSQAQDETAPQFLRPTTDSLVAAGWLEIAVVVPDNPGSLSLTLDGQPIAVKPVALGPSTNSGAPATSAALLLPVDFAQLTAGVRFAPAWLAVREITPGNHELKLGSSSVRFRAFAPGSVDKATSEALKATSTTLYAAHPMSLPGLVTCASCHNLNRDSKPPAFDDMSTFLPPFTPDVCFRCHPQEKFLPTHTHRVEHLAVCQMCHNPHGSNRPKLMKMPRWDACKKCHE